MCYRIQPTNQPIIEEKTTTTITILTKYETITNKRTQFLQQYY
ncbi:hypothetical protein DOY81_002039 [Sarcophaga bullata]|nr:hypothetical protein DOY81_002039 [Sarcophaga bullata]